MARERRGGPRDRRPTSESIKAIFKMPEKFAGYRLADRIGWGGGGEIWRAQDDFGNTIAFKLLPGTAHATHEQVQRFVQEGQILANLNHQGICRVRDVDRSAGMLYIAMEYIDGVSLDKLINFLTNPTTAMTVRLTEADTDNFSTIIDTIGRTTSRLSGVRVGDDEAPRNPPTKILPLQQCLSIAMKICDAIQYAHERGILHRDIKPSNVMMRRDGEPVVLDFGIAKTHGETPGTLTQTGDVFGTIEYMAPEQAQSSRDVDERSDVYSIGAVLYQLVTGRKHFVRTGNIYQDISDLKNLEPARPRTITKDIDHDLEAIILKALSPNPLERYRSAKQLRDDLARYQGGEPVRAKRFTWTYLLAKWVGRHRSPVAFSSITLALVLLFGGYFGWDYYRQWGRWLCVYHRDFTAGAYPVDEFAIVDPDLRGGEPWEVDSLGLLMRRFSTAWLKNARVPGDVRVVADIRFGAFPDGFEMVVNGADDSLGGWSELPRGYSCQYGGYFGSIASVSVNHRVGMPARTAVIPLFARSERRTRVMFERRGPNASLWVNGREVVSLRDALPLHGKEFSRIGMRCYTTTVHVERLDVYHLSHPEKATPLLAGDALYAARAYRSAVRSYMAVADDHQGKPLGEEAMVRALTVSPHLAPEEGRRIYADLLSRFAVVYPRSRYRQEIDESELMMLWESGAYGTVLGRLPSHCERYPESDLIQRMVDTAPDSIRYAVLKDTGRLGALRKVNVRNLGVPSLDFLDGSQLCWLDCGNNAIIRDLRPLQSMSQLTWLSCPGNAITDLTPLAGKPIVYLDASLNRVADADVLARMPLRYLSMKGNGLLYLPSFESRDLKIVDIQDNSISDLSALGRLRMSRLFMDLNEVTDLSPLAGMGLELLSCSSNRIESLEPLKGMPLKWLNCSRNRITDLSPLRGMDLEWLNVAENQTGSLEPLRDMPLTYLACSGTGISSLEPLAGMPLTSLAASRNKISSLASLRDCPLRMLSIGENPITSLEALRGMQLRTLLVKNCMLESLEGLEGMPLSSLAFGAVAPGRIRVSSLEPLRGMKLQSLEFANNRVTSLELLRGMPLTRLDCEENPLTSLEPFVGRPPEEFYYYSESLPLGELERARDVWASDSSTAHHARAAEVYIALRKGDWRKFRTLAVRRIGRWYLKVPLRLGFDRAQAFADSAGGHLATVGSLEELGMLAGLGEGRPVLTGAIRRQWQWEWANGEAFDTRVFRWMARVTKDADRYLVVRGDSTVMTLPNVHDMPVIEWKN